MRRALAAAAFGLVAVLAVPAAWPAVASVTGPDVANYQHPGGAGIDWDAVAAGGSAFTIIKATQGNDYTNPYFASDWAGAGRAGLVRGAYDFADPGQSSAAAQAEHFLAVVGDTRAPGELAPILDLEITGGLDARQLVAWVGSWVRTVEAATGRAPILYTDPDFWDGAVGGSTAFAALPLWLADYTNGAAQLPHGWTHWTLWQFTDAASIPGIATAVDLSRFAGSPSGLAGLANGAIAPIMRAWAALGGARGALGAMVAPAHRVRSGWSEQFAHGAIYWSPGTGAHALLGPVAARYALDGGPAGPLGWPTSDQLTPSRGQREVLLEQGRILFSRQTGAHAVSGSILTDWLTTGGPGGQAGLPETEASTAGLDATGQRFSRAQFFRTPNGTYEISGPFLARWVALGGEHGLLGLPASAQQATPLGPVQLFQTGVLAEPTGRGAVLGG